MSHFREDQPRRGSQGRDDPCTVESRSSNSENPPPELPPDSPGSSVSLRLQEEYDELLKYAVVVPEYSAPKVPIPSRMADSRGPFDKKEDIITLRASPPPAGIMRDLDRAAQILGPMSHIHSMAAEQQQQQQQQREASDMRYMPDFGASVPRVQLSNFSLRRDDPDDRKGPQLSPMFPNKPQGGLSAKVSFSQGGFEGPNMSPINFDIGGAGAGGGSGGDDEEEEEVEVYTTTTTIDHDVGKLESMLDQWCVDLKRNVLAHFTQAKVVIEQRCRRELNREATRHAKERGDLVSELDGMKEYLHSYEQTVDRKDNVVSNLTEALYRQRDKLNLLKNFSVWRSMHADIKREQFTSKLARLHYERVLKRRVLLRWFSIIAKQWKERVERACQTKAQEVCRRVSVQYENKIASMNQAQQVQKEEIKQLQVQRESYEDAMKKAFMRGVCALNMEAMSIFHQEDNMPDAQMQAQPPPSQPPAPVNSMEEVIHSTVPSSENLSFPEGPGELTSTSCQTKPVPQNNSNQNNFVLRSSAAPVDDLQPCPQSHARVVTSQGSRSMPVGSSVVSSRQSSGKSLSGGAAPKGKVVIAKVTSTKGGDCGRAGGGRSSSPSYHAPVASVVVERHQPVTKQTIGQATAAKMTRPGEAEKFRKLAGQQSGAKPIHTVRVVD